MASYDNEIYRGPPEAGPTLERDIRSYGSDVYILKAEKNTLTQDVPPTEEPIRQEAKPAQKKESKMAKAMKLLASCTAAAAIAVNLTVPPAPPPPVEEPESYLNEWPGFDQFNSVGNGFSFSVSSQHSNIAQASTGTKSYRITAKQDGLHLFWHTAYNTDYDATREGFCIMMDNWAENWFVILDVHTHPQEPWNDTQFVSQFITASGEVLYLRAEFIGGQEQPLEKLQNIINHLSDYIEISDATEDGWGKVLIGRTMYSDVNAQWNGIMTTPDVNPDFCFSRINYRQYAEYSEDQFIRSLTINDIDWSFYYSFDEYSLLLWAVPSQEDIALGAGLDYLVNDMELSVQELAEGSPEINAELMDRLGIAVELAAKQCFSNYHLYTGFYDPPVYFPDVPPADQIDPGTDLPPDIQPDDPYTEEYFIGYPFSFEGRSFQMDSLSDDILFRQIYQAEDHAQFDFRVDSEGIRVQLIISAAPNGKDYYPYYLDDGTEIFVAAFNYWGEPWIADEQTLAALARNLSAYVYIDESTDENTEWFDLDKSAYDWINEYSSYDSTPDGVLTHTCYGWSNRTCQLNVNNNAYRLESMTPEVFICWDDYSYDTESQSGVSQIRIYHLTEAWNLETWVSDNPEHLASADFSLTMEDGTQLWFYVWHYYAPADQLQDIIQRIPDLIKLTPPKEDGWNKVCIGKTMISDMNMQWNGRNSTVGTSWCIEQILSREAASEYAPQFIETRTVNGITWNFYTASSTVFAVPQQEDIWLSIPLQFVLNYDRQQFRNGQEFVDYCNANIGIAIDRIINEGLIYYQLYP